MKTQKTTRLPFPPFSDSQSAPLSYRLLRRLYKGGSPPTLVSLSLNTTVQTPQALLVRVLSNFRKQIVKIQIIPTPVVPTIIVWPPMEDTESAKGAKLLRALRRRLAKSGVNDDCRSSSTDSSRSRSSPGSTTSVSPDHNELSCSSSDTGSEDSPEHRRRSRKTTSSFHKVLQSLSISSRSHSCSSGNSDTDKSSRSSKKNPQPKKILRPPVTYTYVRGLSGLPTQRIPLVKNSYGNQRLALSGLNR